MPDSSPTYPIAVRILVVEDEQPIQTLLRHHLEGEGLSVTLADDAEQALDYLADERPHLLLLDWMLPGMSGLDLCRQLRRDSAFRDLPILLLTAKGEEEDRVRGLETGADDYVPKPFSNRELMARVHALLRRSHPELQEEILTAGSLQLHAARRQVFVADREVALGPTEFRLLQFLISHPGQVFERSQLLDRLWGPHAEVEDRTVDVHIRRLRKALEPHDAAGAIQTVRGAGYRLRAPD
jgi:two-component system phosphate regulon response regulator PhoB